LVAPSSSKALNNALTGSHDKSLIEFKSGHVGLMIGKNAHKELAQSRRMDKEPFINY
jgi:poly(3-hydroxyalkanoate) synthetase